MDEKTILVIGEWSHIDFATSLGWLDVHAACTYYRKVGAAAAYLRSPARQVDPLGILLVQSRPGQFSSRDVECLHSAAPLARLVALVGPWCEGEQRSGRIWPGVIRVPWHAWPFRLARELGIGDSLLDQMPLPRTATEPERIDRDARRCASRPHAPLAAAVHTQSRLNYETIAAVLAELGVSAAWHRDESSQPALVDIEIYDGWPGGRESLAESDAAKWTTDFRQRLPTPSVLLLHFPRPDDLDRARTADIGTVVALPLLAGDLAAAIASVFRPSVSAKASR